MPILKNLVGRYGYLSGGFFLAYYFKSRGEYVDDVSRKLLEFKDGHEPITSRWIEIASNSMRGHLNPDLIIRVLESTETEVTGNTPLDRLGRGLTTSLNAAFIGNVLYKLRQTKPLKFLNKQERFNEINEVYRFRNVIPNCRNILLIDDIVTSGTTIKEIKRAINETLGNFNLYLFILGKTYDSYIDENPDNTELNELLNETRGNPNRLTIDWNTL